MGAHVWALWEQQGFNTKCHLYNYIGYKREGDLYLFEAQSGKKLVIGLKGHKLNTRQFRPFLIDTAKMEQWIYENTSKV